LSDRTFPWKWVYTTGGVGFIPGAPGTYASALCVLLWYLVPAPQLKFLPFFLILVGVVGIVASEKAVRETGRRDPSCVVIDEWLGQGVTLLALPHTFAGGIVAFVTFRFFDILKPPPIRWLERAPGGWGVMLDDLGAGICGYLVIRAAFLLMS